MIRHAVTYRQQQPAPTEPGWYYGRMKPEFAPASTRIEPVCIKRFDGETFAYFDFHYIQIEYFDWFGPVLTCREG